MPVLISRSAEADEKVAALDASADDYVTSHSTPRSAGSCPGHPTAIADGNERACFHSGALWISRRGRSDRGKEIKLTPTEYSLLRVLVQNAGKVVTHRQLLRTVWGEKAESQAQYLRVYVTHLRKKLGGNGKLIKTEVGIGYRLSNERL